MIIYNRSAFGLNLLFRIHGSAVYRAVLPCLLGVTVFLFLRYFVEDKREFFGDDLGHPYAIGALVASSSFLVVFRANQGYARYWEGAGAVHHMMSKWMDATTHTWIYHLQCDHYKAVKPPSYFDYPELNHLYLTRDRERGDGYYRHRSSERAAAAAMAKLAQASASASASDVNDNGGSNVNDDDDDDDDTAIRPNNNNTDDNNDKSNGDVRFQVDPAERRYHSTSRTHNILHTRSNFLDSLRSDSVLPSATATTSSTTTSTSKASRKKHHRSLNKRLLQQEKHKRRYHAVVKSINKVKSSRKIQVQAAAERTYRSASSLPEHDDNDDNNNSALYEYSSSFGRPASMMMFPRSFSAGDLPNLPTWQEEEYADNDDDDLADDLFCHFQPGAGKPFPLCGKARLDGNLGAFYTPDKTSTPMASFGDPKAPMGGGELPPEGFASIRGGRTPHLFLQELAHLSSLMVAVAFSTLRNDIDGAESPLTFYDPGSEWPTVDPDKDEWMKVSRGPKQLLYDLGMFLGMGRSPEAETRYNAGRPLPVIGGVSDAEIRFLQMARGPLAKTQLCWSWLSEFVIREHLAGSLGKVGPPIISRIIQFLGDGMIFYNHARKIMFIPFPFAHAQLSILFILVLVPVVPFLMEQYTSRTWVGCFLTFFTLLCLAGVNEVARELENPFRNVPNELPLVTFMAQYNEALIVMYSGFHPDHYWDGERMKRKFTESKRKKEASVAASASTSASVSASATSSTGKSPMEESTSSAPEMNSAPEMAMMSAPEIAASPPTPIPDPPAAAAAAVPIKPPSRVMSRHEGSLDPAPRPATAPPPPRTSEERMARHEGPLGAAPAAAPRVRGDDRPTPPSFPCGRQDEKEEIANLKLQLEKQAQLIEQLFAKVERNSSTATGSGKSTAELIIENDNIFHA